MALTKCGSASSLIVLSLTAKPGRGRELSWNPWTAIDVQSWSRTAAPSIHSNQGAAQNPKILGINLRSQITAINHRAAQRARIFSCIATFLSIALLNINYVFADRYGGIGSSAARRSGVSTQEYESFSTPETQSENGAAP
ncbi:MAG TPA: hypothetical protein VEJ46_06720 [Candidatus Acidoferrum sp.]|nr:hypothetical protein [Candidatus Acidoferrum sp.]